MNTTLTSQRVHDVIVVADASAAAAAVDSGADALVLSTEPSRVDLLHRPFRVWLGEREHRAHTVVVPRGAPIYRDYLAHDSHGNLVTERGRTSVEGVFTAGCEGVRRALAWLGGSTEPVAA